MTDDIFHAVFHFEDPSGASSCSAYYQQTADNTSSNYDTFKLAEALESQLAGPIVAMLSNDFWFSGVTVRKNYDVAQNSYLSTANPQLGLRSGPGLPSNNAIVFNLNQNTFPIKSNGRMFWPGIPEADTEVGTLEVPYYNTQVIGLATALLAPVSAILDTGEWQLGVISQKVLNLVPPAKDWPGAFAFCNQITVNPIIGIQRRRRTKVIGAVG